MSSVEVSSCCSCYDFRQYFTVKRVKRFADLQSFSSQYQNNSRQPLPQVQSRLINNMQFGLHLSLRSWLDSCARGTFLVAEPPCEVRGKIPLAAFLMSLNAAHFCQLVWNHLITQS